MARRARRNFTVEEKVALLRRHLVEGVSISDICEENDLQPTVFYRWQKALFENAGLALAGGAAKKGKKAREREERKLRALESKLEKKNEVLAELMEEHVALKKSLGEI